MSIVVWRTWCTQVGNTIVLAFAIFHTWRLMQNGGHFPDDILKWIFFNENGWMLVKISLKFVAKGPINNIPALVQIMAWRRPGDKPLSEIIMVSLLTLICVTRLQWINCWRAVCVYGIQDCICNIFDQQPQVFKTLPRATKSLDAIVILAVDDDLVSLSQIFPLNY